MALDVVTLGEGQPKAGGARSGAGGSAYGGTPDYEAPFICLRRYPPKEGLGPPSHHSSKSACNHDPVTTTDHTNNLSLDLAEEALVGQCRSVPLGSPSPTHPPSSSTSPGHRPVQRTPPTTSASTCPSSSIYATASPSASPRPGGTRCASTHDWPKNQDRAWH